MLVVLVQPIRQGVASFLLAGVAAGVGPPVGHGPVEALYLAVGLRPVRTRPLRGDREGLAGVPPQVRAIGATVVGQHPLHGDAAIGKPRHSPMQDPDRGDGGLVVVDLGVRDAGVVVNDGVHERVPEPGVVPLALRLTRCRRSVVVALAAADVAPAAAVGDVAELLHVDVQHRPGLVVLVAADRLPGCPVDMRKPVQVRVDEDPVNRRRSDPQPASELHGSFSKTETELDAALRRLRVGLVRRVMRP